MLTVKPWTWFQSPKYLDKLNVSNSKENSLENPFEFSNLRKLLKTSKARFLSLNSEEKRKKIPETKTMR